ncbi:MAG: hypothetical protein JXA33_03825 [Anaerolineae bacterium]|nr:hypothetical protein [Anaerolineae bacterium]
MGKLEIKFSTAEMLLITSSMKIASFPNLDQSSQPYSNDELKIMLTTARDSLMARGLVRIKEQDGKEFLDLHPIVKAAVGVATRPEKGWWLTVTGEGVDPQSIFFSWTEKLIISNWLTREGIFCFEQVAENELPSEILKFSSIRDQGETESPTQYAVPIEILDAIAQDDKLSSFDSSQLTRFGLSGSDAKQLSEGLVSPLERCILIAVSNLREQSQNVGLVIWFTTYDDQTWLIEQDPSTEEVAILKKVSGDSVLSAITALVEKTLA